MEKGKTYTIDGERRVVIGFDGDGRAVTTLAGHEEPKDEPKDQPKRGRPSKNEKE